DPLCHILLGVFMELPQGRQVSSDITFLSFHTFHTSCAYYTPAVLKVYQPPPTGNVIVSCMRCDKRRGACPSACLSAHQISASCSAFSPSHPETPVVPPYGTS